MRPGSMKTSGRPGGSVHLQVDPALGGHGADHAAHDVDDAADRRPLVGEVHPPRLDLGDVEDVVHQLQEVAPRDQHVADVGALLVVELAEDLLLEQLGEPDHRVERRAQLVAHVGEEGALGLVGGVGGLLGLAHLALRALALARPRSLSRALASDELAGALLDPHLELGRGPPAATPRPPCAP